jgi:S1-C subfamily serine protease
MRRFTAVLLLVAVIAGTTTAQALRAPQARTFVTMGPDDADRAMLGIATASGGIRDTLGLLVTSVEPGGPAEKAGIVEGSRLQSINGVNLRLSRDDAADEYMQGINQNRLIREMRKMKPGDEVTLQVWADGQSRTVKVKTVAARDLVQRQEADVRVFRAPGGGLFGARSRNDAGDRAALGVVLAATGTKRDTLGVFVQQVVAGGPADKAGIVEGDRIASINGVDVRVAREDAGDPGVAAARIDRLQRELGRLKPGDTADLVVVTAGRSRPVKVSTAPLADIPGAERGFKFEFGPGTIRMERRGVTEGDFPRALDDLRLRLRDLPLRLRPLTIVRI